MSFYTAETIERVKKIDLLSYLKNNEPDNLVKFSRDTYCTREHDSLKINNGKWYWFSKGIGGYSALDYLIKVKEFSFMDAMKKLIVESNDLGETNFFYEEKRKISKIILPEKNDNNDIAKSYLMSRGIDEEIIDKCIYDDFIYETKDKHNVVFVGYDQHHNPRFACIRGTNNTRFMQDASGSDKEFSFRLLSKNRNDTLHIFESAIDLLSYATLMKMSNKDWENENFLALAGVYQSSKNTKSKVPIAVSSYLNQNRNIKKIFIHFDSDSAGINATISLKSNLENNYQIVDGKPYVGKDWNDFLVETIKNQSKKKENSLDESR